MSKFGAWYPIKQNRDLWQDALINAIKSVESGKGKLLTIIAVLRELNALDGLDSFIPEPAISPLQLARQQGKKRQRASGKRLKKKTPGKNITGEAPLW